MSYLPFIKSSFYSVITIMLLLCSFSSNAQNIRIEGVGQDIGGKDIRVIGVEDFISRLEKEKARYKVKEGDSTFSFALTLPSSTMLTIRIDAFDYNFIAEPGKVYQMRILPFNFNIGDTLNTLFYKIPLPILIENETENDLNRKVFILDTFIENFIADNKKKILVYKTKIYIDSICKGVNALVDSNDEDYFKNYAKYSLASVLYSSDLVNKRKLKIDLFFNKPILYSNIGYMDCFEFIYGSYFTSGNKIFTPSKLDNWLEDNNYFALIDSLGSDTLLRNEVFRELVFLRGMKEAYFSNRFEQFEIINMLDKFSYQTKFSEHRTIAKNLLELFDNKSFNGSKAIEFELKDINGKSISFSKLSNKPIIISFVKLNEIASLRELEILHGFQDTLKTDYNILTITCDRSFEALYNFIINSKIGSKYKWDFAHFDGKWVLLEQFNIRVFPTFIMIDEKGVVSQNPMKKPSEGGLIPFIPKKQVNK